MVEFVLPIQPYLYVCTGNCTGNCTVTVTCRYSKWSNTCLLGLLDALKDPGHFKNLRQLRLNFVCFLITKKWTLLNLPSVTFNKGWQCMLCQLESLKRWRLLKLLPSIAAMFVIADQQSLRAVPKVWTLCKSWHHHYKPFNLAGLLFLLIFFIKTAKGS